jgi:hypothetical protein
MPHYFVEFNPFFGSPDHVPSYITTPSSLNILRHLHPDEVQSDWMP